MSIWSIIVGAAAIWAALAVGLEIEDRRAIRREAAENARLNRIRERDGQ